MECADAENISCPCCGYTKSNQHDIQLHIEEHHTENSPFVAKNDGSRLQHSSVRRPASPSQSETVRCAWRDCGKDIALVDIAEHLQQHEQLHESSSFNIDEYHLDDKVSESTNSAKRKRSVKVRANTRSSNVQRTLEYFAGGSRQKSITDDPLRPQGTPGRLGRRDLGPHAYEKAMPVGVRRKLEEATHATLENKLDHTGHIVQLASFSNETSSLIPVLEELATSDATTVTHLCDPNVKHVRRIDCDGNFCGYWNIQMMLSYLQAKALIQRHSHLPSVIQIQETIEKAWSKGICAYGKVETGGILNTRKWIGTSEAAAYFTQRDINITTLAFRKERKDEPAHVALLNWVEAYFVAKGRYVHGSVERLAPIYLQRSGHSVTIVGMQRHKSGGRSLLIFDPSNRPSQSIRRLAQGKALQSDPERLIEEFRWSEAQLAKYSEYEILTLR